MSFFAELKRRNVLRVGMAYVALAWLLIQVAETVFPAFGLDDHHVRVVIVALGVGLVPVLVLAWAFELTPEGLRLDRGAEAPSPFNLKTARRLDRLVMVLLALALGYFAFDKFLLDPARDQARVEAARQEGRTEALVESYGDKSIAVLPFANMSADPEQEYFSDGIAEEILNLLAKVPELRVISRSSSFTFRDSNATVPEIAERLGVGHILEGSVRRAGEHVRITIQLIEARSDTHLWSETYDDTLEDVFEVQERVAREVSEELQVRLLGGGPRLRRTDTETWTLYLRARHIFNGTRSDFEEAEKLLQQALARDPGYVPAWNLLAIVYSFQAYRYGPAEAMRLAGEANLEALALAPDDPVANVFRGFRLLLDKADPENAAARVEKALARAPGDPELLRMAGAFAGMIGRFDESIRLQELALARDPLCFLCLVLMADAAWNSGRLEVVESALDRWQAIGPGGWISRGRLLLRQGRPLEALEACGRQQDHGGLAIACETMALHDLGREQETRDALARLLEAAETTPGFQRAEVVLAAAQTLIHLGDADAAMSYLTQHIDPEMPHFTRVIAGAAHDPKLAPLAEYPLWRSWLSLAGLDPERLAGVDFELPPELRARAR